MKERTLDLVAALHRLAEDLRRPQAVGALARECPDGFLAEPATLPAAVAGSSGVLLALRNGYAAGAEHEPSGSWVLRGVLGAGGVRWLPDGRPWPVDAEEAPAGELWRVETGAELPPGTDRVIPVEAVVITGSDRVRVTETPPAGANVAPPPPESRFAPGERFDGRLRSLCVAGGASELSVRAAGTVAVGSIGDELTALGAGSTGDGAQRTDVSGLWLEAALASLGHRVLSLGVLSDQPRRLGEVVRACERRGAEVVVLCGGVGDGVSDRVLEGFGGMDARVLVSRVGLDREVGLVHARTSGLDVLCLPGLPLLAAALFDTVVAPALVARLGAAPRYWDWTRRRLAAVPAEARELGAGPEGRWRILPAARTGPGEGHRALDSEPGFVFWPVVPGQDSWLLAGPAGQWHAVALHRASEPSGRG